MLIGGISGIKGRLMKKNFVAKFTGVVVAAVAFLSAPSMGSSSPTQKDLDLVILVDESSSLNNSDVQAEISAVISLISRRELSGEGVSTQVAIAGFGSGSSAVDEKCAPTFVTTENILDLRVCAEKVRRRSGAGQSTDFAKAFEYASATFDAIKEQGSVRAVILLTDGKYDPEGKRSSSGLTAADIGRLNESTAALRERDAQIWPLGFGQVEEDELNDLARSGAKTQCPTGRDPYAIVADDKTLDNYLLEILGDLICRIVDPPTPLPSILPVHPFTNEVVLTVRDVTEDPEVVVEATQKLLCAGEWKLADDGSRSCAVTVLGADVGTWKITAQTGTVETSQSGRVDLRISDCKDLSATVSVSRIDNTEIQWNLGNNLTFPRAVVVDTASRKEVGSILLTSDDNQVTLSNSGSVSKELEVSLASNQSDFVWLTASIDSCNLTLPETSTSISPTSSNPTPVTETETDDDDGLPWLLILSVISLLFLLGWYLLRRSRNSKFPSGAEFQQRNVAQNPSAKWNTRADLSGLREVFLSFDRNGWLIEASKEDANLIVRKLRSSVDGDFVVVQVPRGAGQGEADEGTQAFHAYNFPDDPGSGIAYRDTFIRVVVPEELEDEDLDSEEE